MDPKLWSKLPTDLVRKIIEVSEPTIDVQLAFKIQPKKLDEARVWRLWYLLKSHDGLIYNLESRSLHIFRVPGFHMVRRPYHLNRIDEWMTIFNEEGAEHTLEITSPNGTYISCPWHSEPFYTELRVLLRGSGIARALNVTDATF
jgi:hypothetical protein